MAIERVATNIQAQYMLSAIMQATRKLNTSQQQVASGKVSSEYSGIGGKTAALEAARASAARADAYQSNTQSALNQVDLQDSQLTQLSKVAGNLHQAMLMAAGNNDATGFMTDVQAIFDQAAQILNARDSNGNYLFGGDKDDTPPFNVTSLSQLVSLPNISAAFSNGTQKKSVMVGDGQPVQIGVLASDIGTQLMQTLKDIATFDAGPSGGFSAQLTTAQQNFLSSETPIAATAASGLQHLHGRERLCLQPAQRGGGPADGALHALQGVRLQYRGRRYGNRDHPAQREPDRAAGRAAGDRADGPDLAAQLSAGEIRR